MLTEVQALTVDTVPRTVTLPEAARLLGIGKSLAYELVSRDQFPCRVIRAGKRIVVPRRELDRLLGANAE